MNQGQRASVEAMVREVSIDAGGDLDVQRPLFEEFMRQQPEAKAAVDVTLTPEGLRRRVTDYAGAGDPSTGALSPLLPFCAGSRRY
jgi:hypothetical protein